MINVIPHVYKVKTLPKISFSTYTNMKECIFKGLPSYCIKYYGQFKSSDKSNGAVLGNLFHYLLKTISGLSGLNKKTASQVLQNDFIKYLDHIENLNASKNSRNIKKLRYSKIVDEIYTTVWMVYVKMLSVDGTFFRELKLKSNDSYLYGILDELYLSPDCVTIVDYKTTHELDVLGSENNIEQLHLYSYLVKENYGFYPTKLRLVGLLGLEVDVELNVKLINSYSKKVREYLFLINKRIEKNDLKVLCSANEINCSSCHRKIICPKMSDHKYQNYLPKNRKIVEVEIIEVNLDRMFWQGKVISGGIPKNRIVRIDIARGRDDQLEYLSAGDRVVMDDVLICDFEIFVIEASNLYLACEYD